MHHSEQEGQGDDIKDGDFEGVSTIKTVALTGGEVTCCPSNPQNQTNEH